jgi:hypothetical protein
VSPGRKRVQDLLGRFWVVAAILLVVCVGAGALTAAGHWTYWGQPETEVTVTDVVSLDAGPVGQGRTCRSPSELAVVDADGRTGTLYDCASSLFEGDTTLVRWHPEEDRARNDVLSPRTFLAIAGGIYAVMLLVLSGVWWSQRRRNPAGRMP